MRRKIINQVQDYLTVVGEDGVYQIVNVEMLLKRHPPEAVIAFLNQLRLEYKKELGELIKINKTDPKINDLLAKNWRIKMAVVTIKHGDKKVKDAA